LQRVRVVVSLACRQFPPTRTQPTLCALENATVRPFFEAQKEFLTKYEVAIADAVMACQAKVEKRHTLVHNLGQFSTCVAVLPGRLSRECERERERERECVNVNVNVNV
jgi:hypothetical protein